MSDELRRTIKVLNETVWEQRVTWTVVEAWLSNFDGQVKPVDEEREVALYVLSHFMYFGSREIRELLRAMYRDLFKYPLVHSIRRRNGDTLDSTFIDAEYLTELAETRFLGIGNPSESGTHLLYYFRQENRLSRDLFINAYEIFKRDTDSSVILSNPKITRFVFLDDLSGSGTQAKQYSTSIVSEIKRLNPNAETCYYVLFATDEALKEIRYKTLFDRVNAVFELDATFKCFGPLSRYFDKKAPDKSTAQTIFEHYGINLWADHPLGFRDGQLLLGFHHNTPDNTLPPIWFDEPGTAWRPVFKRYTKLTWY